MSKPVRLILIILGALAAVLILGGATVYVAGGRVAHRTMALPLETLTVSNDTHAVARGRHLAAIWGCTDCHGEDLAGKPVVDDALLARIVAPNLTRGRGGIGGQYSHIDYERALRHGVARDGRLLAIMPSQDYNAATDEDIASIIAYLGTIAPVDHEVAGRTFGPLGRLLALVASDEVFPATSLDHDKPHRPQIDRRVSAQYGEYLAKACTGCHGADYAGAKTVATGSLVAPNLTPDSATGLGAWMFDDFRRVLREGRRPDGTVLDSMMPWYVTAHMADDEIQAVWSFLRNLPARPEAISRE